MKKIFLSILLVALVFTMLASATVEKFVVRISNPSNKEVSYFSQKGYDIASYNPNNYIDLVVTNDIYNSLLAKGYNLQITQTESQIKQNLASKDIAGYRSYEDMLTELQDIAANHPDICKLYDIGDSWGKIYSDEGYNFYDNYNHEIWALKISDNVETEEDEPYVYYIGEHHAREPISTEVVMKIIEHLITGYGNDADITENIDSKQIWCIPLLNPNGHKIVVQQTDMWWRKNIRDNNDNHQFSNENGSGPDGVDPNRNYGFEWGSTGASDDVNSETYHGPEAFSEPNTQAIKALIDAHKFVAGISYHSYSELVLFPLGYANNTVAPDHDALEELAISMANTIPKVNGGYYTPQESWQLYPCMGTSEDYFYGEDGVFAYTIELATEFIPPASVMNQICDNNIEAAMILLDRVDNKVLTGHITDSSTSQPIESEIFVEGVDDTGVFRNPYTSETTFGRYYRLLMPGTYNVTFSKYGYQSQTESVTITEAGQTNLDIQLQPTGNAIEFSGIVRDVITLLPISNVTVGFPNSPIETVQTDENGEFYINEIFEGSYEIRISADGYATYSNDIDITADNHYFPVFLNEISGESFENGIPNSWTSNITQNDWYVDAANAFDGTHSLRSNDIFDNQTASFAYQTANLSAPRSVSFYCKVSSEESYDYLRFYIDNIVQNAWSGESDWTFAQFSVPAGVHTLKWSYEKDSYVSDGDDCAWIDMVSLPDQASGVDMVAFPNQFDINMPSNSTIDTTLVLFNNSGTAYNCQISQPTSWMNISNDYSDFNLPASISKVVELSIDSSGQSGTLTSLITVNYGDNETLEIPITVTIGGTDVGDNNLPVLTSLKNSYPNPFMATTSKSNIKISYQLAKQVKTSLTIFNLKGQLVKTLVNERQKAGNYNVLWNAKDTKGGSVSTGIYFYKLNADGKTFINKLTIIK